MRFRRVARITGQAQDARPPVNATLALDADFPALLATHRGIVLKIAASYTQTREDRADLAQDIAMQAWQARASFDPARTFSTWLYRVALNVAISRQRRERHRAHLPLDDAQHEMIGDTDVDAEAREQLEALQRAMQSLNAVDRALLVLHLDGCGHRESAEVLGTTEGNVATRLNRIRNQLKRQVGADA